MYAVTLLCALAISVASLVVVVLHTSRQARTVSRLEFQLSGFQNSLRLLSESAATRPSAQMAADLDALAGALETHRQATRKELGALWGRLGGKHHEPRAEGVSVRPNGYDGEIADMLALQSAPPARP